MVGKDQHHGDVLLLTLSSRVMIEPGEFAALPGFARVITWYRQGVSAIAAHPL